MRKREAGDSKESNLHMESKERCRNKKEVKSQNQPVEEKHILLRRSISEKRHTITDAAVSIDAILFYRLIQH